MDVVYTVEVVYFVTEALEAGVVVGCPLPVSVAVTGQMVVEIAIVLVTTLPTGQLVTVGAQDVTVSRLVV